MKWILGLLCLMFLVLFHELGHFVAAKIFGVKVESFSIGFGPVLLHKKIKGTDYRLSLFPLGGYCGMKGEKDFQKAVEEKLPEIQAEKDSLYGVHPAKRALIGFSGPLFNFIFAILAFTTINLIGFDYYTYSNKIILPDATYENASTAAKDAGLLSGDEIIQIENKEISEFSQIIEQISIRPDEDIKIKVLRDGQILEFTVHSDMDKSEGSGKIGIMADTSTLTQKQSEKLNFFEALGKGFTDSFEYLSLTIKSIGILFKGVELQNAVSGPARITDMLGSTIQDGFAASTKIGIISILNLLAFISISLFFMNLLPIPVLDGGIILIAFIEMIIRKKINPRIQYYIQFIGIAFIAFLFFIGLFGDIKYFFKR